MGEVKLSRRQFLNQSALAGAVLALGQSPFQAYAEDQAERAQKIGSARQPNIIFILADDLGWADLSVYGRSDYQTKYLDKLAKTGVRLTQAYSNSAVCSPTRVGFLSGGYQQRLQV